jgi:hypothetical protein
MVRKRDNSLILEEEIQLCNGFMGYKTVLNPTMKRKKTFSGNRTPDVQPVNINFTETLIYANQPEKLH